MGFREKILWVSVVATIGIWGWYLLHFVAALGTPAFDAGALTGHFLTALLLLIAIQIGAAILLAVAAPREANRPADARERDYARRANGPAYATLTALVGVLTVAVPMAMLTAPAWLEGRSPLLVAVVVSNALLFALILAGLVQSGVQLFLYRRGG